MKYKYNPYNYDLRPLPNISWSQFFDSKRDNENFGFARHRVCDFSIQCDKNGQDWLENIQYWFDTFTHKSAEWHKELLDQKTSINFPPLYEFYLKVSWLSKIFITEGFKYPLGAFWHPRYNNVDDVRKDKNTAQGDLIIHPGGGRQVVVKIFSNYNDRLDCLAFGTAGKRLNFVQTFNTSEEFKKFTIKKYGTLPSPVFVASKGTLIPHPLFGTPGKSTLNNNLFDKSYVQLMEVLKRYNIQSNFDSVKIPCSGSDKLVITVDDPTDNFNVLKALLLLPFYNDIPTHILQQHGVSYESRHTLRRAQ